MPDLLSDTPPSPNSFAPCEFWLMPASTCPCRWEVGCCRSMAWAARRCSTAMWCWRRTAMAGRPQVLFNWNWTDKLSSCLSSSCPHPAACVSTSGCFYELWSCCCTLRSHRGSALTLVCVLATRRVQPPRTVQRRNRRRRQWQWQWPQRHGAATLACWAPHRRLPG